MGQWHRIQFAIAGNNGGAQGSSLVTTIPDGILTRVRISSPNGALPATADVQINMAAPDDGAMISLLSITNIAAPYNGVLQVPTINATNGSTGSYAYPSIDGRLIVNVQQGNAGTVTVYLLIE